MKKMFAYFTIDAIGSCAFGVDCDSFSGKENEFLQYGTLALKGTTFTPLKIIFARAFPNLARKMHLKLTNPKVEDFFRNMTK
ncbi:hypothetical protein ACMYMQ_23270, partial [Salmonella enterica subsp. enterica serovar Enteritidis]|uniref:hypothetical protein n=1 Tax=Salmonella enterica TaxID=28901 RepID=UPI0039EAB476